MTIEVLTILATQTDSSGLPAHPTGTEHNDAAVNVVLALCSFMIPEDSIIRLNERLNGL